MILAQYCDTVQLVPYEIIMKTPALTSTLRYAIVKRGETILNDYDVYIPGETLNVDIYSPSIDYVIEVSSNAAFIESSSTGCNGKRVAESSANIIMPSTGSGDVKFTVAWATGETTVFLNSFTLIDPINQTERPTYAPNTPPAIVFQPTIKPVASADSYTEPEILEYPTHIYSNIFAGIIGGGGAFILLVFSMLYYIQQFHKGNWKLLTNRFKLNVAILTAFLAALASVILVFEWSQDKNDIPSNQRGFLGVPSWETNILPWHPILLVMFFAFQVIAAVIWSIVTNNKPLAKVIHICCQCGGLISVIVGYVAIFKYKNDKLLPNLTTLHSWLGIATIVMYGINFCFGILMASLTQYFPDSIVRKAYDLKSIHQSVGLIAFGLTILSVETGIMDQLGQGCYYSYPVTEIYGVDKNPADNYPFLPDACKIANGLGLTVVISGVFVIFAIVLRSSQTSLSSQNQSLPNDVKVNKHGDDAYFPLADATP